MTIFMPGGIAIHDGLLSIWLSIPHENGLMTMLYWLLHSPGISEKMKIQISLPHVVLSGSEAFAGGPGRRPAPPWPTSLGYLI